MHEYIEIEGDFTFMGDAWGGGSRVWCSVDGQMVWLKTLPPNPTMCTHTDYHWSTRLHVVVKHQQKDLRVEFAIQPKGECPNQEVAFTVHDLRLAYK